MSSWNLAKMLSNKTSQRSTKSNSHLCFPLMFVYSLAERERELLLRLPLAINFLCRAGAASLCCSKKNAFYLRRLGELVKTKPHIGTFLFILNFISVSLKMD